MMRCTLSSSPIAAQLSFSSPWSGLPDTFETLGNLAAQLQTLISLAIAHPIRAVLLVVLTIALLQIVADLIKRALKATLTFILKLPLSLSQWLWKRAIAPDPTSHSAQLSQLMTRLDTLRAEQDQVVAEIKSMLSLSEIRTEQSPVSWSGSKPSEVPLDPPADPETSLVGERGGMRRRGDP